MRPVPQEVRYSRRGYLAYPYQVEAVSLRQLDPQPRPIGRLGGLRRQQIHRLDALEGELGDRFSREGM